MYICVYTISCVPGSGSVRIVPDSCIHRLRPFSSDEGTVQHSVSWSGPVSCCSRLVGIRRCNSTRKYPLSTAAVGSSTAGNPQLLRYSRCLRYCELRKFWDIDELLRFLGHKVIVQGHDRINYAAHSTLRVDAYSTH